jgi:hypothetical protein
MNSELAARLLTLLDEYAPLKFELPVPLDQVVNISINTTTLSKKYLQLSVNSPNSVGVLAPFECVLEDITPFEPVGAGVLTRVWVTAALYLQILFGEQAPHYILIRCTPSPNQSRDVILPGASIGTAIADVEVAFLSSVDPSADYLDPAIIVRILAFFGDPFQELLLRAIEQDPVGSFGLQRFFDFYDELDEPVHQKLLYQRLVASEFDGRINRDIPTDLVTQSFYRIRLPSPGGTSVERAALVATYHSAVEGSIDKFASFYITDLHLLIAIFRADHYEMDLIDIRDPKVRFHSLSSSSNAYKVIANGPVFDPGACGMQPTLDRARWYMLAEDAAERGLDLTGRTKGTLVFRGRPPELSDCPIPSDPSVWRYHFAQSATGHYGLHLDPIPSTHDYSCAVEPVIGVFRDGKRIGIGHEIDTNRKEPDAVYAGRLTTQGIPILGRCMRSGTEYLFVLMRPDTPSLFSPFPRLNAADWEEMLEVLRDINVVDAFITDGDDSVGFIIDNVLALIPGLKKDSPMPLAIGFRKV